VLPTMGHEAKGLRVDRILLDGIRNSTGRWILATNGVVLGLYLASPWGLAEVLVAFWLEAVVVAALFAGFLALTPGAGPTLLHRGGRVLLWLVLATGFLALTGAVIAGLATGEGSALGQSPPASPNGPLRLPPLEDALGAAPWVAVGWIVFRSIAPFADVLRFERSTKRVGLAASRFFGVYLPVLGAMTALYTLAEGVSERILPLFFLAVLTYYELVLTLKLLPLLEDGG
jgi:hypothetical protein